jgi:hypothetical protein
VQSFVLVCFYLGLCHIRILLEQEAEITHCKLPEKELSDIGIMVNFAVPASEAWLQSG